MRLDSPTSKTLLDHPRDNRDAAAWEELVEVYTPRLPVDVAKHGLQTSHADGAVQATLLALAQAIQTFGYDRSRGSFRDWLLTVAHSKLNNFFNARERHVQGSGDTDVHQMPAPQPVRVERNLWEEECRCPHFDWAVERIRGESRESSWNALWWNGVSKESISQVQRSLGLSVNAAYIAKNLVMSRLREKILTVTGES